MGDSDHKPISPDFEFCSVRGDTECACGNDYRGCCRPSWAGKFKFRRGTTGKSWGKWEAHHILSISCVNWLPKGKQKQQRILAVLNETKWCINAKRNMIAMPKFGHTIMYYVDFMRTAEEGSDEYIQIRRKKPPPFQDLPQHDFEHNTKLGYCHEVKKDIEALWNKVSEASAKHKTETAEWLVTKLDALSDEWSDKLTTRGKRHGGTHSCWNRGRDEGFESWYVPFSMATEANAAKRSCPLTWDPRATRKMDAIWDAMCDAGAI